MILIKIMLVIKYGSRDNDNHHGDHFINYISLLQFFHRLLITRSILNFRHLHKHKNTPWGIPDEVRAL